MALLGNLKGSAHVFPETEYYNNVGMTSVRFEDGSSTYLTKTFSSDGTGSGATCTISCWVKRANISNVNQWFFTAGSSSPAWLLGFRSEDTLQFGDDDGNPSVTVTDRKFRDVSAWYHIVLVVKTSESSNADKYKIYVNGELQTTTFSGTAADTLFGANVVHNIGRYPTGSTYVDLYMSDLNFVDGLALDPTYFGESKNGIWIPKEPVVSEYGTNGFRFKFDQTGVGSGASNTIGADSSGKDNHFTSSGIATSDCAIPDNPENNFCTLNPLEIDENSSGAATSEGNLGWTNVNANIGSTFGFGTQGGKYYWEYLYVSSTDGNQYQGVTLQKDGISLTNAFSTGIALYFEDGTTRVDGTSGTGFGGKINADNIIQFKLDLDNGTLQFGKNNTYIDALTLPTSVGGWRAGGIQAAGSGGTRVFVANYGQDSSFAGNKTAQGNTDENGLGDFYYAVPSGFLAVCSANLPEPTVGPNSATQADDHFNTVLYTGDGSGQSITGVGFQPDWTWIKSRSHASSHVLTDSSRGVYKSLFTDTSGAEQTLSGGVTAFGTDGFTLGSEGTVNTSSRTYVGWNWKANGGTTSSNTNGSITSTVQANTNAGFSIVTYTGTGSNATVGHGLSTAPDVVLVKGRSNDTRFWTYWGTQFVNTSYVYLNTNDDEDTGGATITNSTYPSSTVFSIGTSVFVNGSSETYVAYCFHEVDGYSKFANFTGNGNADGTFVYTGFRPAWVLIKNIDRDADWRLHDIARQPTNDEGGHILLPNSSSSEVTNEYDIDFLSNGFKLRSGDVYENGSGELLIYLAFAEQPFKYANAK